MRSLRLSLPFALSLVAAPAALAEPSTRPDLAYGPSGLSPFQLSIFESERFQRRFVESYQPVTEVEPTIPDSERETLATAIRMASPSPSEEPDNRRRNRRDDASAALSPDQRLQEAITFLRGEINETSSPVMHFTLGNFYFQKSFAEGATPEQQEADAINAVEAYRRAVDREEGFPRYRRAWDNMAKLYVRYAEYAPAVEALTEVIRLGGRDSVTYGLLGFSYGNLNREIAAESAYRQAILLDDETIDWKLGLARSLFKQRRYAAAAAFTQKLIEAQPEKADFWLLQANAYIGMGDPVSAAYNYEFVDQMGASTADSLNALGDIYVNEELYGLAVGAYAKALRDHDDAKVDRGLRASRVLAARGAYDEVGEMVAAVRELRGDALTDEEKKELLKLEARIALAEDDAEQEAAVLERIVELDPLDGEALMQLGQYYRRNDDREQALFYFERAEKIEGFEADSKVRQAQIYVSQGKYSQAVSLLRGAQSIKPREAIQDYLEQVERISRSG